MSPPVVAVFYLYASYVSILLLVERLVADSTLARRAKPYPSAESVSIYNPADNPSKN
jgi:hypothetical protein